jgi:ligand-binding sensor domain-containing protein
MKTIYFLFVGLVISSGLFAQHPNWENITNTNIVTSLYNDGDTLWVGTFGGLVKYNKKTGASFCYNRANAGLNTNNILDISKDSKNNLWIAGRFNGIGCLKNGKYTIFNNNNTNTMYNEYCKGIYIDKNDSVFVGSNFRFNRIFDNQLTYLWVPTFYSFSPQYIKCISPAPDGGLVFAASSGIYSYKNGEITYMYNQMTDCNVAKFDKLGNLWVGTKRNGLYKYGSNTTALNFNASNSDVPTEVLDILIDKNDNIWVTGNGGLINFKETGNSVVYNMNIANDGAYTIIDDDTCIWVGTSNNGLYRFKNGVFEKIALSNSGLKSNYNLQLCIINGNLILRNPEVASYNNGTFTNLFDSQSGLKTNPFNGMKVFKNKGIFTYGTNTVLGYFENGNWQYYNQFLLDNIKNIAAISPDTFWVSTSNRGLLKYVNGQILEYNNTNSPLPNISLSTIELDNQGVLWGSFGSGNGGPGIYSFNGSNWSIYTSTNVSQLTKLATSLKFDTQNNLWCNAGSNALIRYNGTNWTQHTIPESLMATNTINNIFIDNTDTIWTAGSAGATKFDRATKWEAYTIYNSGLVFNSVQDIVRLPNGDVYMSHSYGGISVLKNSSAPNSVAIPVSEQLNFKVFPVPGVDRLTIEIPASVNEYSIEMYDLTAKPVYLSKSKLHAGNENLFTINTSAFPKGIYIIKLITDKESYSKRISIK